MSLAMKRMITAVLTVGLVLGMTVSSAFAFPFDTATWDSAESPNRKIMIVGDSLVAQSGGAATALGEQREHSVKAWGISGGAACDFTPVYGGEATAFGIPDAVAFAFVGNASSDCMVAELGWTSDCCLTTAEVAQVVAVYRKHLLTMINWNKAMGVESWLIASPIMANGTYHGQMTSQLNTMLSDLATTTGTRFTAASRSLLSPGGVYTDTVGGLPVRHPDGTHLRAPYGTGLHALGLLSGPMTGLL